MYGTNCSVKFYDVSEPDLDEKYSASPCDYSIDRKHYENNSRPTTPFQLPFPALGPFADLGETASRQNSILGFLQQQGFIPSPVGNEESRYPVGGNSPYRCVICLAAFPSAWLLEQHNSLQHSITSRISETGSPGEDKPFKCEQCGQSYRYRSAYLKHQEQNHRARLPADKLFTCDVCGMQFRYLKSFKKHRLNHALEKLHTKSPNGDVLTRVRSNGAFEKYLRGVPESSSDLSCRGASLFPFANCKINSETKESGRVTAPPSTSLDATADQVTSSNEALSSMSATVGGERSASVPISKFDRMNLFKLTKDSYHFKGNPMDSYLGKSAKDHRVSDSEQDETIDTLAPCPITGNSEVIRCQQESSSPLVNLLRMDPSDRQRENRFSCPFCGKCVRSKENLKLHIRKHTGERPFVCLFCGRAFGGKSDLTRHLRIHTGERPYHCEMCGKCFARADYLSKHLTTHIHSHNTRPSFSQAGNR
ncbi:hypothetical protein RUM43_001985 [Polyplax serrata]|uniref:C2H2-type domain-containing protein n=1 Tax=Polyplax serrata TaxID=468196 RepID=A0AAN8PZ14_POLSC